MTTEVKIIKNCSPHYFCDFVTKYIAKADKKMARALYTLTGDGSHDKTELVAYGSIYCTMEVKDHNKSSSIRMVIEEGDKPDLAEEIAHFLVDLAKYYVEYAGLDDCTITCNIISRKELDIK